MAGEMRFTNKGVKLAVLSLRLCPVSDLQTKFKLKLNLIRQSPARLKPAETERDSRHLSFNLARRLLPETLYRLLQATGTKASKPS